MGGDLHTLILISATIISPQYAVRNITQFTDMICHVWMKWLLRNRSSNKGKS